MSSKHQITVPKFVRRILELEAGDLVVFVAEDAGITLTRGELKIDLHASRRRLLEAAPK